MLENAAREPEVVDLANCLSAMGAKIAAPAPTSSPSRAWTPAWRQPSHHAGPHRDRHLPGGRGSGGRRHHADRARADILEDVLEKLREAGAAIQASGEHDQAAK